MPERPDAPRRGCPHGAADRLGRGADDQPVRLLPRVLPRGGHPAESLMGRFREGPGGARAADRPGEGRARGARIRGAVRRAAGGRARRVDRRPVRGRAPGDGDGARGRSARAGGFARARVELLGRAPLPARDVHELFDGIVISAEEGIRKPSRRMYELGAERAGVPPRLRVRRRPAVQPDPRAGARHGHDPPHRAKTTIPQLEELLGVRLGERDEPNTLAT